MFRRAWQRHSGLSVVSTRIAIMKHAFQATKQPKRPPPIPKAGAVPEGRSPWRWAVLGLCLFLTAGGTWAVMELVVWNKLPPQLVGKWAVQGGEQDGATFDFFRNGTMVGRLNMGG